MGDDTLDPANQWELERQQREKDLLHTARRLRTDLDHIRKIISPHLISRAECDRIDDTLASTDVQALGPTETK